jgi:hypothetical protein
VFISGLIVIGFCHVGQVPDFMVRAGAQADGILLQPRERRQIMLLEK